MQIGLSISQRFLWLIPCFMGSSILGILGGLQDYKPKVLTIQSSLQVTNTFRYILYMYIILYLLLWIAGKCCTQTALLDIFLILNALNWMAKTGARKKSSMVTSQTFHFFHSHSEVAQRVWCWTKIGLGSGSAYEKKSHHVTRAQDYPKDQQIDPTRFRSGAIVFSSIFGRIFPLVQYTHLQKLGQYPTIRNVWTLNNAAKGDLDYFEIHLKVLETLNVVDKSKYANLIKHVPTMSQHWVLESIGFPGKEIVSLDHLGLPIWFIHNNYQLHQPNHRTKRPLRIPNIVVSARTPGGANLSIPSTCAKTTRNPWVTLPVIHI